MITASSRWLSVIMVCLVVGCHQAHLAQRSAGPGASGELSNQPLGPNISAFSLRAAERILMQSASPSAEVTTLAGITRPLGLVYDPAAQDLIVFGEVGEGDPILLDDLVVMMRTVVELGAWPLCSIDRTAETAYTGMQTVRFEGIENTSLGADCFAADTTLKSLALGHTTADDIVLPSYFDMLLARIEEDGYRGSVSSRLWGYPMQPSLIRRENTFAIRDLKIGVQAESMSDPTGQTGPLRDEIAQEFAQRLTQNYEALTSSYPELGKMAVMFRLAALAYGMRSLHDAPDLRYWLDTYDVPAVTTETEYPALFRADVLDVDDGLLAVQVEGGIGMEQGTLRLEDGDLSVLRTAVLGSRPDPAALTWRISLRGAWFETEAAGDGTDGSNGAPRHGAGVDAGTYLTRHIVVIPPSVSGGLPSIGGTGQIYQDWRPVTNPQPFLGVQQSAIPQQQSPIPQPGAQQPQTWQPLPPPPIPQQWVPQPPPPPRIQQPPIQPPQPRVQQPEVQQAPQQRTPPQAPQQRAEQPQVQQQQVQQPQVRSAPAQQSGAEEPRGRQSEVQRNQNQKSDEKPAGGERGRGR